MAAVTAVMETHLEYRKMGRAMEVAEVMVSAVVVDVEEEAHASSLDRPMPQSHCSSRQ